MLGAGGLEAVASFRGTNEGTARLVKPRKRRLLSRRPSSSAAAVSWMLTGKPEGLYGASLRAVTSGGDAVKTHTITASFRKPRGGAKVDNGISEEARARSVHFRGKALDMLESAPGDAKGSFRTPT